jgi:hypothetical protein
MKPYKPFKIKIKKVLKKGKWEYIIVLSVLLLALIVGFLINSHSQTVQIELPYIK